MLTRAEKIYLAMTLGFLAAGSGIRIWRKASVRIGPVADAATLTLDSLRSADSLRAVDSTRSADATPAPDTASPAMAVPSLEHAPVPVNDPSIKHGRPPRAARASIDDATGPVNLNRAEAPELMRVKGIGGKTAEAIIAYRRANGPFKDVRDLLQIKGIGEKKLEKLAPHLIL